jgi:putative addiction module killer protein
MFEIFRTAEFVKWRAELRDRTAALHVSRRMARLAEGNFGDSRSVGSAVSELRIDHGPGYRIYFTRRGRTVVILLCGGDKSTQARDIKRAQALAKELDLP